MARWGLADVGLVGGLILAGCAATDPEVGGLSGDDAEPSDIPAANDPPRADEDEFDPLAIPSQCPADRVTGSDVGQVPANFELYDAEGEPHRLWDHCGKVIMVFAGAQW